MSNERWTRLALALGLTLGGASLSACKKQETAWETSAPSVAAQPEEAQALPVAPTAAAPVAQAGSDAQAAAPSPTQAAPSPAAAPVPVAPTPAATPSADGAAPAPAQPLDYPPFDLKVGDVVRNPAAQTPGWVLQQVLVANLEPDFEKGWAKFQALLHPEELAPKALASRKTYNYAASRRKAHLFIHEKAETPVFAVDRVVQEEGDHTWRVYLRNHSIDSMPTPCVLKLEPKSKQWRVATCSL